MQNFLRFKLNLQRLKNPSIAKEVSTQKNLTVLYSKNLENDFPRLGIVATKKIGNAVCRNRGKRLVREAFRLNQENISQKLDIVIILRKGIHKAAQAEINQELTFACRKI